MRLWNEKLLEERIKDNQEAQNRLRAAAKAAASMTNKEITEKFTGTVVVILSGVPAVQCLRCLMKIDEAGRPDPRQYVAYEYLELIRWMAECPLENCTHQREPAKGLQTWSTWRWNGGPTHYTITINDDQIKVLEESLKILKDAIRCR